MPRNEIRSVTSREEIRAMRIVEVLVGKLFWMIMDEEVVKTGIWLFVMSFGSRC